MKWTENDVHRLRLLAGENITAETIAKTLNRSVGSVKLKAFRLNLSLRTTPKAKAKGK